MNIVILGGCGYIGSYLAQVLRPHHWTDSVDLGWFGDVTSDNVKGDFRDLSQSFFDAYDVVILVAAHSSVPMCNSDVLGAFRNNVANFVELTRKLTRQKLIYASSSCVYVATGERAATEEEALCPTDSLSFTKTSIDHYIKLTGIEYYGLRFGSVNGWSPNFRPDLMINSMTKNALNGGLVRVSNGHCHRPILGMSDLGRAVWAVIEGGDHRGIYNVSSFNGQIGQIGEAVSSFTGAPLVRDPDSFTYDFCIDASKFETTYNFKFTDTVESIVTTIKTNHHNLKDTMRKREVSYV